MKKVQIGAMPKMDAAMMKAFDRLRVNLGFCGDEMKTIMVTSSVTGEGKTFVSMQIWKRLAEVGIPTLLIDCDLQHSQLCGTYITGNPKELDGITHYLSGQAELEEVLYETNMPNGYILPATSLDARPEILIADKRFPQMIETCKKRFGCVLIDTPTIGNLPDVMTIAGQCDGTILVVRSASTSRKVAQECAQTLQHTGRPLIGIVLNCFDENNKSNGYYYRHRN